MPDVDLVPTEEMAEAAARGLALRKKHNRGGTAVGVARARDIKNRTELSPETVKRMVAFFDRHEKNKAGGEDDAGYIAWLLWGGDPGRAWANRKVKELERKQENGMSTKATAGRSTVRNVTTTEGASGGTWKRAMEKYGTKKAAVLTYTNGGQVGQVYQDPDNPSVFVAFTMDGRELGRGTEAEAKRRVESLVQAARPGKKATMATKPKDPAAALKTLIAEARKIGVSSYALDIATYRAQAAMTAAEVATLARDLKAAIDETKARKKAEAAAQAAAAEQRVQALIPKRGVVGRAVDRARTAVATLTTKTVDPTSATYTDALAGAKERGKAAVLAYKQAATAHAAALARLDKYVAHAAQSIAGAQSAKDVAHFLSAIEAATRTRAVAARSMPTPFARPGAKAKMAISAAEARKIIATIEQRKAAATEWSPALDHLTKQRTFAQRLIVAHEQGDSANISRYSQLLEKAGWSRPGAKAKFADGTESFLTIKGVRYRIVGTRKDAKGNLVYDLHGTSKTAHPVPFTLVKFLDDGRWVLWGAHGGEVARGKIEAARPGAKAKVTK